MYLYRSMENVLQFEEISFSYPSYGRDPIQLFQSLCLNLKQGSIHVVLGEPGSGKSTLAQIAAGLVPKYTGGTLKGRVCIFGEELDADQAYTLIDTVSLVMQDPEQQILTTSCEEEIAFPLESSGMEQKEMKRRVGDALEFFGLSEFRRNNPSMLSGGEKKKLMLAAAYALDAPVLILDESLEEVDASFRAAYLRMLQKKAVSILYFASKRDDILFAKADFFSLLQDKLIVPVERDAEVLNQCINIPRLEGESHDFLNIQDLEFSYPEGFELRIKKLDITKHEITALVGPNGSGKSTLCKLLCGLLAPQAGSIRIRNGNNWEAAASNSLTSRAGYMFQNPDYQIFLPTVDDELSYGLRQMGLSKDEINERITEAKKRFVLPEGTIAPTVMSYGERKQLQAAVYYLLEKDLYIFDEIDSGLSFPVIERILSAFTRKSASVLLITHHMGFAQAAADRILTMKEGRIISDKRIVRDNV